MLKMIFSVVFASITLTACGGTVQPPTTAQPGTGCAAASMQADNNMMLMTMPMVGPRTLEGQAPYLRAAAVGLANNCQPGDRVRLPRVMGQAAQYICDFDKAIIRENDGTVVCIVRPEGIRMTG